MAVTLLITAMRMAHNATVKIATQKLLHGVSGFMVTVYKHRFGAVQVEFHLPFCGASHMLKKQQIIGTF